MDPVTAPRQAFLPILEREDVGALRRAVGMLARKLGASDAERGRAELAATELGTNALFHGRALGYALAQPLHRAAGPGLEILVVDRGPGIRDVEAVLRLPSREQVESRLASGSDRPAGLGCGLASVQRLATGFDVHSAVGLGTVVLARFLFGSWAASDRASGFRCGAVSLPLAPDDENGDAWAFVEQGACGSVLVVDGLGHGKNAAAASVSAVAELRQSYRGDFAAYFREANRAMRGTRGGAALLCRVDRQSHSLCFAGLGNVEGRVYFDDGTSASLMSRNGTLGLNLVAPDITVRERPWAPGATLVVHSDGLRSLAGRDDDRALWRHDPAVIAAVLHRDLGRHDDATVVVLREAGAAEAAA